MPKMYAAKRDANEAPIVKALRLLGCTVFLINNAGSTKGVPDLLVGYEGAWHCLEVKNKQGRNRLSEEQKELQETVKAPIHIVYTLEDALKAIGLERVPE